jgi:LPS-assembly protein
MIAGNHARRLLFGCALLLCAWPEHAAAQLRLPAGGGIVEIRAKDWRKEGDRVIYEGDVDVRFQNLRLRADVIEYDIPSSQAVARGRVQFDLDTQHLDADEARYNLRTGRGLFKNVRGSIRVRRAPNPSVLLSDNPFSFEAREVERVDERTYVVRGAWVTVCEPDKPVWRFRAPRATVRLERRVELEHANFRFFDVPVLYLPYASVPIGRRTRQSGFLLPHIANTSRKGFVIGDAFYWAPADWMDLTLGAEHYSRRGVAHSAEFRSRPWENMRFDAHYFAVNDRGLPDALGVRQPQAGHQARVLLDALLPGQWRAVLDVNKLTSLNFRLAFAETFAEAVNSEVKSAAFVTNNFRGFSLNFFGANYKNFLSAAPETAVVLRAAPGVRLSSVEQSPWPKLRLYFGFDLSAEAVHRSAPGFATSDTVQRLEMAPRVTLPLRWGPWFGATPSFTLRSTRYSAQSSAGALLAAPLRRTTGELELDVRPPALARIWDTGPAKWKHVIEPQFVYRFVRGVNQFDRFIRFDDRDTLTDTNEIEYSITQRLFRRSDGSGAQELLSWRVAQKHYFDPTFNGALVPGQRNVLLALHSLTAFAFADGRRAFSPVVSDFRVTPGGRYDAQFRLDIDPQRRSLVAVGTSIKMRPYKESFVTLAHFGTRANPVLQPRSDQIRALVGYGEMNRRGWNTAFGFSYDVRQRFLQNQIVQVSYNGSCCGIGFEYRRLALGPLRSENQFRVALLIANIGTFGSLRRQEKIFE